MVADSGEGGPAVRVLGDMTRVAGVVRHLPASWSVRPALNLDGIAHDELVLLVCPDVDDVAAADRQLKGRPQLVVLLDELSPVGTVAAVLEAGADVCVCVGSSAVLASHLIACRRRLVRTFAQRRVPTP